MDQKALDDAYDQIVYAPNRDQVHKRNVFNSDRVRARLGAPKRLAYGPTPIEALDLFATTKPNAPINVFIHGGAWRQRDGQGLRLPGRDVSSAPARIGSVSTSTASRTPTATCCRWPIRCAAPWPGSTRTPRASAAIRTRIYRLGQSSGAHLGGCVVTTDWKDYGVPQTS